MRFPLKTVVQIVLFFSLMIFLNAYISLVYHNKQVSVGESPKVSGARADQGVQRRVADENGARSGKSANENIDSRIHLPEANNAVHLKLKNTKSSPKELIDNQKVQNLMNLTKPSSTGEKLTSNNKTGNNNSGLTTIDSKFMKESNAYSRDYSNDDVAAHLRPTELRDIFLSVKTTQKFHRDRVELLLDTWVQLARDETYFFTDDEDEEYDKKTGGHLINTNCSSVHSRVALCCKMSVEYDYYIASNKRWFCHVDDDTYVNVPQLSRLLRKYNHNDDWYLGKPSLTHPIEINDPESVGQKYAFWFATGGAGFCLSRGLALKMMPFTAGGKLKTICSKIRLPDDCTIGFVIYYYLHKQLTSVDEFHSHLEGLWRIKSAQLDQQITLSYNNGVNTKWTNIVQVQGFGEANDPSRFRSIHCRLFPYQKGCPEAPVK